MFKRIFESRSFGVISTFFIGLGITILIAAFSFVAFTLGYWLITLILAGFFGFFLPFSWWYSLGAWLIALILSTLLVPGLFASRSD